MLINFDLDTLKQKFIASLNNSVFSSINNYKVFLKLFDVGNASTRPKDYDLKFKVDGNKLQGYVDNQLLIEAEDSSNPFKEGMMGFLTENGAIQSNSISIE